MSSVRPTRAQAQLERKGEYFPPLLSVRQLALYLSVGYDTAREMTRRGEVPTVRVGRRRFVPQPALKQWLAHGAMPASSPMNGDRNADAL